jgi:peptidyl-dipeptidase Dcp
MLLPEGNVAASNGAHPCHCEEVTREILESEAPAERRANPLLEEWPGDYGGVPPFAGIRLAEFEPALDAAMSVQLAEVERIASQGEPASFANTIEALERAGRALDRVLPVYEVWCLNLSTRGVREMERRVAPALAAFADRITQNERLFQRIATVYEERSSLTPEQQRLCWLYYTDFVRSGARLDAAGKARLSEINQRLAMLFTAFNQNVLADEDEQWLTLRTPEELEGLPASLVDAAAAAAEEKGEAGSWVITNARSSMEPFLVYSRRRDLRERGWRLWTGRADGAGGTDNHPVAAEILGLRAERARLLGYETHAHWRLENAMAREPAQAVVLLERVWPEATARVRQDVAAMQEMASAHGDTITIEPWDYRYYAEQVRAAQFDLDQDRLREYLQLDLIRDAMFWVAGELFGLDFVQVHDVPVFHEDVGVWSVERRSDGSHVGLWYFDAFARAGKKSGAWMMAYRSQEAFDGAITPIVSNNCNYVKGRRGEPVLISWVDATTLFHEFGHALHGLCSNVRYPSLSGTAVPRDFVEFPSQLLEHWLSSRALLGRFALHHRTGAPMPDDLIDRIQRATTFNQGFATTEYLACALIDMRLHLENRGDIDTRSFEERTLAELGMPREIVMRHRTAHFQHAFGSDGYSAGYYSYLWADTLVADAWEAFQEAGDPFDRTVAARLLEHVLAVGNTIDPAESYRRFRGRDADSAALLRKRGFA